MAGTFSLEPCSTSSSCNHQGKRSESSLLEKRLSEDSSRHWRLQKWASMSSADASRTLLERREEKAAAAENPLVFLCVSSNVSVDKEQKLSKCRDEDGCILETLYCSGCSLSLGYVYRCTPKNLDYKRNLFCLSVEAVESYTLGSSEQQIVSEEEFFNLESRVEIEKSIKQMEDVLTVMQAKLWEVESKLSKAGRYS